MVDQILSTSQSVDLTKITQGTPINITVPQNMGSLTIDPNPTDPSKFRWKHKVDMEWLSCRGDYLTASEAHELIPFTKTGRPRVVTDEMIANHILAKRNAMHLPSDCLSFDSAARGHILEP